MCYTILVVLVAFGIVCAVNADCGPPPVIPHSSNNASVGTVRFHQNNVILYRCDDNYLPRGGPIFTCRNGVWFHWGGNFECRLRECGFLEISHGHVTLSSYTVGSVARFTCEAGYQLRGSSVLLCLVTGEWDPVAPTCAVRFCPELPEVNKLFRFQANEDGELNDYTSVVTNRCEDGYRLVGDSITVCQADGTWSGEAAYCDRIDCGSPDVGGGTVSVLTDTYFGGLGMIRCYPGYLLVGEETIICDENGWLEGYCYGNCTVGPISNGYSEISVLREGEVLHWSCDTNGFVKHPGDRDTICHDGTLTPPPECRIIEFGQAGCPSESNGVRVTRWGDMCFIMTSNVMSYDRAEAFCRNSYGGRVLTIQTSSKMDFIAYVLSHIGWQEMDCSGFFGCSWPSYTMVWLGLYYSDTWRWPALAGERAMYTKWQEGEGGTTFGKKIQKCAVLDGGQSWEWNDKKCDGPYNVVCETYAQTH